MAEASALNSVKRIEHKNDTNSIKEEEETDLIMLIKPEPHECAVCVSRSTDCVNIAATKTASGTRLADFLYKYTACEQLASGGKMVCKSCYDLVNVLEQAELEYLKLKDAFEAIISKNPLFEGPVRETVQDTVKLELELQPRFEEPYHESSEDEPLAVTKKKRRKVTVTRKKKTCPANTNKRKPRAKKKQEEVQKVNKPEVISYEIPIIADVKKEDSMDGSETSSQLNNGLHSELKLEMDDFGDDDDDDDYFPDDLNDDKKNDTEQPKKQRGPRGPKKNKTVYECDQCDAKYTSYKRFDLHKEKHSGGKPPYICEVCGASYKHKRACDIHIALHQGISDWKCEECNKLFPSKGALQRHNNIHTGKLNYQCDLCGKSFIHTSSFKMHKLSHSGLKPHTCDICGLALMTRSHLKRHKRVHSGEKRHECTVCGKRFSERYNLVAHSKSHESAGETVLPVAPRRRLFRCYFCQERFERRYMLERHMSLAHNRTLERSPATPRNTMSKLLKAQAAGRGAQPADAAHAHAPGVSTTPLSDVTLTEAKEERSPESRASSILAHKLIGTAATITATSWSGAYAAEFGLRTDYTH
ncbi:hypothetical protein O0L34_g8411 [Tuta absoluta]|nr:hypothetical protein O0L34_g8411 [Tuta absoluta]